MDRDLKLRGTILHKLDRKGKWGPVHTSLDNLPKGLASDLRGEAKAVAKALIKEGLISEKPTSYGIEVSLRGFRKTSCRATSFKYPLNRG
jgi:hypothetical protein